ncbi:MAG: helix-turn-helix domain-containing protein [Clostridiales bacterium]|nr:helix-turn-helix domain-containing protein [Clostridiales bacterium]
MSNRRYTTEELAEAVGLSRREVDRLRKTGKIPFLKVGGGRGRFLFILEDVEKALQAIALENQRTELVNYSKSLESHHEQYRF